MKQPTTMASRQYSALLRTAASRAVVYKHKKQSIMKQLLILTFILLNIKAQSQDLPEELTNKIDTLIEEYIEGISP